MRGSNTVLRELADSIQMPYQSVPGAVDVAAEVIASSLMRSSDFYRPHGALGCTWDASRGCWR